MRNYVSLLTLLYPIREVREVREVRDIKVLNNPLRRRRTLIFNSPFSIFNSQRVHIVRQMQGLQPPTLRVGFVEGFLCQSERASPQFTRGK